MYYLSKSSFSKGRKQGCQQPTICVVCLFLTIFVYLIPLVTKNTKRQKMLNLEKGVVALSPLTCTPIRFWQFLWSLFQYKWLQLSLEHLDASVTFLFQDSLQSRRWWWGKSSFRRNPLELSSRKQRICGIDQKYRALVWAEDGFISTCGPAVSYHLNQGDSQNFRKACHFMNKRNKAVLALPTGQHSL